MRRITVLWSSILKWSDLTNLLSDFKLIISLLDPSDLGVRKILDKNWLVHALTLLKEPVLSNLHISCESSSKSLEDQWGSLGIHFCIGILLKGILKFWICERIVLSDVIWRQFSEKYFRRPAVQLTSVFNAGASRSASAPLSCRFCDAEAPDCDRMGGSLVGKVVVCPDIPPEFLEADSWSLNSALEFS